MWNRGMMGAPNPAMGLVPFLIQVFILVDLILVGVLLWKKINKK